MNFEFYWRVRDAIFHQPTLQQRPTTMTTLTKADLAELLFEKVGLNKREAKDVVESFFDEIRLSLEKGDIVKLSGFGNFQCREKPQRPGRNPKTGEEMPISARRVVTFHASQKLKSQVEGAKIGTPSEE
ncbi:MAG: integration host factor subunit alpha [Thiobacillus sp.]|nr:integration host factor subunit alpha [Thiobacillus sp.]